LESAVQINNDAKIDVLRLGRLQTPVFVVDDVMKNPENLFEAAQESDFKSEPNDYYPGVRAPISRTYIQTICEHFFEHWRETFSLRQSEKFEFILSAFSMTTIPEKQLKPIQMLPHFDTEEDNQIAIVHYLCDDHHGGTGFYRHKTTSIERVVKANLSEYGRHLKQEAMAAKLHLDRKYVGQEHPMFTSIGSVAARFNRLIAYPSNLLHSGLIKPGIDLSSNPNEGRLTTSSFVRFV